MTASVDCTPSCRESPISAMRAHDLLDALDRVTQFRAQAADSNRRVEDIGSDLDSAISLLDLRQSREGLLDAVGASATTSDCICCFSALFGV